MALWFGQRRGLSLYHGRIPMKNETGRGEDLIKFAWQSAAIAVVACVIVFGASTKTAFKDLNSWTYDFTVLAGGDDSVSKDVVLVDVDEESFARIGKFPIPRSTFADLVTKIAQQQPKIVGMDVLLSEARSPEEDQGMQAALVGAGSVVLASQSPSGGLPPVIPLPVFCQPEDAKAASSYCEEGKPGAVGYAFVNLPFDSDGFIRQGSLFFAGPPQAESFPLMLAELYSGEAIKPVDHAKASFRGHPVYFADQTDSTILIGSWSKRPVPVIPAWKVLAGTVPADALTGKLVLIGQTNDAARDRLFSPMFRREEKDGSRLRLGGTEILGAAIRSLLEGKAVRPAGPTGAMGDGAAVRVGGFVFDAGFAPGVGLRLYGGAGDHSGAAGGLLLFEGPVVAAFSTGAAGRRGDAATVAGAAVHPGAVGGARGARAKKAADDAVFELRRS